LVPQVIFSGEADMGLELNEDTSPVEILHGSEGADPASLIAKAGINSGDAILVFQGNEVSDQKAADLHTR
jgi:predicted metalloprotease with PDZ domain